MSLQRNRIGVALVAITFLAPGASFAQSDAPAAIDEITVTAQKREQSAQDVGISLTAITGEELERGGFGSAQEVTALAAGVSTVQPNGEANYAIGIRGVANSDFTTNVESPVAIYVDEVYISQMSGAGFQLFDMERVEILRGPQGTLFGRNATGGLAHFVTRKPTEELGGYAKITIGEYEQFKGEGAVGGALIPGLLSARVSGQVHWNDGYVENRLGDDLNNANDKAGRLQLLLTPSEDLSVLLNVRASDQDIRTGFFENVSSVISGQLTPGVPNPVLGGYVDNDGDVYAGDYNDPGFNRLETWGVSATINWNIGDLTFTSISDYQEVERDYIEDSDASPVPFFNFYLTTDAEQFSQEFRLAGSTDRLDWVAGFYYLDIEVNDSNGAESEPFLDPGSLATPFVTGLDNPYTTETESWSVFGQLEFGITEQLSLTAGFRWIDDEKEHNFTTNVVDFIPGTQERNGNPNILATLATYKGNRDDGVWSARLGLNWHPSDDLLLFVSWNRGVKGGGFNAPIFPLTPPLGYNDATLSYAPEELDAFEVGFKSTLLDGRLQLNGSVYYYDYNDYQAFQIIGIDTITTNADAESEGFELEALAIPVEGLTVRTGVAYNDIDVDLGGGTPRTTSVQSPKWNVNGLVRYEMAVLGGTAAFQLDADYRSTHFFALTGLETVRENGYVVANVALSWTNAEGNWTVTGFVRNLFDEEYLVQTFDLSGLAVFGFTEQYYGRPQWIGASLEYHF